MCRHARIVRAGKCVGRLLVGSRLAKYSQACSGQRCTHHFHKVHSRRRSDTAGCTWKRHYSRWPEMILGRVEKSRVDLSRNSRFMFRPESGRTGRGRHLRTHSRAAKRALEPPCAAVGQDQASYSSFINLSSSTIAHQTQNRVFPGKGDNHWAVWSTIRWDQKHASW